MLKKENRLKSHSAFMATYHQRRIFGGKFLTIYLGKLTDIDENKIKTGFVVSTKVHKRSVRRNKIKRYMRESVRLILLEGDRCAKLINKYMSAVIVAKNSAPEAGFKDIDREIRRIISHNF